MKSADIVIIGGGVIGASVAYHLATKGCERVVVIERALEAGQGSTSKATGGFRAQFSTDINVRLSLVAREKLLHFRDELGIDPVYRRCGYLFIARSEKELDVLRAAQLVQKRAGLGEVEEVAVADVRRINPAISPEGIVGGVFCPTDGFIHPMNILHGYVKGAKRLGVRFEFGVDCHGFTLARGGSKIVETVTSSGKFSSDCVVNAAGAWAGLIAQHAGVDMPLRPLKRQVAVLKERNILPEDMPMTVFTEDGFHFRVRDGRVLLLWPNEVGSSNRFESIVDDAWLEEVMSIARERVPSLARTTVDHALCWTGLYEMSPDKHPLVGLVPGFENFYLVNGSSGHGVMHAPALGHLIAELIVDGSTSTLDIHALRPSRFMEGQPNKATEFL